MLRVSDIIKKDFRFYM